jgi:hypothetical protein
MFGATNDIYIQGNDKGDYFLTSPFQQKDRDRPFSWWDNICVNAQNTNYQNAYADLFKESHEFLSQHGANVVYGMVPTKAVLMPNDLPKSTPKNMVEACKKISSDNNIGNTLSKAVPSVNFFYPYAEFKERIEDPLFYPRKAYHWQGESSWLFAEKLAEKYNLDVSPKWQNSDCQNTMVEWDIGKLIGVGETTPGCDRDRSALGIIVEQSYTYPLHEGADKESVIVAKLTNPYAPNDKTAIVFSNSFGPVVRELIASHFKTTYHLRANFISGPDMQRLFLQSDMLKADDIFVTVADFHYPAFLDWVSPADESKRMFNEEAVAAAEARAEEIRLNREKASMRAKEIKEAAQIRKKEAEAQKLLRAEEKQRKIEERRVALEAKKKEAEAQKLLRAEEKQKRLEERKKEIEAHKEKQKVRREAKAKVLAEKKAAAEARRKAKESAEQ